MPTPEPLCFPTPLRGVQVLRLETAAQIASVLRDEARAAHQAGLLAGERRLSEQLLAQRNEMLQLQNGILASLRGAMDEVIQQAEQQLIELAFAIAQKIVGEIPVNAATVEAAVRSALAEVREGAELRFRLHPEDLQLLQGQNPAAFGAETEGRRLSFEASPEVERGGCLVETSFGVIDARRETRVAELRKGLAI